jgi:hypothetical protein
MRILAAAALLVAGAGTGLATVAVHEVWWELALAVAATSFALLALPAGWWTRLPFALGWAAMVGWLVPARPEGDYAIGQDPQGYVVLGLAVAVLVVGIASLPRPGARRVQSGPGETPP